MIMMLKIAGHNPVENILKVSDWVFQLDTFTIDASAAAEALTCERCRRITSYVQIELKLL